jgi:glycosyltransferase involved in cell wall biosynthesis
MLLMKVLIQGWTKIPHSYAIVNVFQIVHLRKNFPELELYTLEYPYYNQLWNEKVKFFDSLYPKEYYTYLVGVKEWKGESIDLIYSITYPYDIDMLSLSTDPGKIIPKCVFYTSEFSVLSPEYFKMSTKVIDDETIKNHITTHSERLFFTCPSEWSQRGMKGYGIEDSRNRIISHGVDTSLFKKLKSNKSIRKYYNVKDDEILIGVIGAMTRNKGIVQILQSFKEIVVDKGLKKYKLMLKGMQDLYATRQFLQVYLDEINAPESLMDNIVFIDSTLSFINMNGIYNCIDVYLSPYIAEGFNLAPLEAMAAGTPVILPRGGSTKEYSEMLSEFGCITFVESESVSNCNVYNVPDITKAILEYKKGFDYNTVHNCISEKLSWDVAAKQLYQYFCEIRAPTSKTEF